MPSFGARSVERLSECCPELQEVFTEVVKHIDCTVLCGHRGKQEQDEAFHEGRSKIRFPNGKHNMKPSKAADVAPYPVDWNNAKRFDVFAGFVIGVAAQMGYKLRWGGDWDSDWDYTDQSFHDLPHFEYRGKL